MQILNTCFQFLNNIIRIFTHFFTYTYFFLISKKVILKKLKRAKTTKRIQRGEQKEKEKKEKNRKQRHKKTSQD